MITHENIQEAYTSALNYPDLVKKLIALGVHSYTVETASGTILYRLATGENLIHDSTVPVRMVAEQFSSEQTIQAIRDNQAGKSDYPGFMQAIAKAGVRFYEATLHGTIKRVTYIGTGGYYEEQIPV